jgi:hypothetical protein
MTSASEAEEIQEITLDKIKIIFSALNHHLEHCDNCHLRPILKSLLRDRDL